MTVQASRATPGFGLDPAVVLLFQLLALAALNMLAFGTMNGFLLILAFVVDLRMAVPLLMSFAGAIGYRIKRRSLARSGLHVNEVVTAANGSFFAFDTAAGKVFADGRVRDIAAIETAQWIRENRVVYVEVTFSDGQGALLRMPVRSDAHGADVVDRICALSGLTFS